MDPFAVIIFGGLGGLVAAFLLLGRFAPGGGADTLDWKPTRSPEVEAQNEIDDLEQMLEAANRRRRLRGAPELTEESVRQAVAEDARAGQHRRETYTAAQEIDQMLEVKNRRRCRKGLPELTEAEFRAMLDAER